MNSITYKGEFSRIYSSFSKGLFYLVPIITLALFEILKFGYNNSSIGKIKKSVGYKYADIFYFTFRLFEFKFPLIIGLMTLGLANTYKGIGVWFSSFYESILPGYTSEFSLTMILILSSLLADLAIYITH